jgi:uncharacterized protein (UPF0212 family)
MSGDSISKGMVLVPPGRTCCVFAVPTVDNLPHALNLAPVVTIEILMATCPRCGANLVDGAAYCHVCGNSIDGSTRTTQEFTVSADDLTKKVKELVHEGNVSRIIVKDEKGKVLIEIPVTAGVVGIVLAPWLAAVGVIAALATKCTLVVERRSG